MFTIDEIVQITNGSLLRGDNSDRIFSVHYDSRLLEDHSLFVAFTFGQRDGHEFITDALENGAIAVLTSHSDWDMADIPRQTSVILVKDTLKAFQQLAHAHRRRLHIPVIAITGSNGKTTTKDILAHLCSSKWKVFKTHRNLNNHIGLPLSLLQIRETDDVAVLEMGMNHAGEIDFLARIARPTISIITNIGDAHLEHFGSREKIAEAKAELLPHTAPEGYILLNGDDSLCQSLHTHYPGQTYYFRTKGKADVYAKNDRHNEQGTSFTLCIEDEEIDCFLPLFGEYNIANLLPGALIARKLGLRLTEIRDALLSITISQMRFQIIAGPGGSMLINDAYNASPASMKASIDTFAGIYKDRKKVAVLGDIFELGAQSEQLHQEVGQYLSGKGIEVITIGDDSRHISAEANGAHFHSKVEAVHALRKYNSRDYALLFKASRGMKLEEIIHAFQQTEEGATGTDENENK